jgi:hypothetical protein
MGEVEGFCYTIEFQKRGLPHAHILLYLKNGPRTVEEYDNFVSAEIPDERINQELYTCVKNT